MGQLDGTANPVPGTAGFATSVWATDGPAWHRGGTTLVIRRIRIELETWDAADRRGKEFAVGRILDTGAPLTGTHEYDEPDLAATDALGLPVDVR
jgi:dye decolorizing peroxidase